MSKLDLLKFMEQYEGEVEIADFTLEYYDDVKVDGGGIRKKDW